MKTREDDQLNPFNESDLTCPDLAAKTPASTPNPSLIAYNTKFDSEKLYSKDTASNFILTLPHELLKIRLLRPRVSKPKPNP